VFADETTILGAGQVRSVQTLAVPSLRLAPGRAEAEEAGRAYFAYLDRLARPVLRVRRIPSDGVAIRLCGVTLLSFGPPEIVVEPGTAAIRFPIAAGLLVRRGSKDRGELRFELHAERLVMAVEGYYPALAGSGNSSFRRWLYGHTQAAVHRRVAARYLDEWLDRLTTCRVRP